MKSVLVVGTQESLGVIFADEEQRKYERITDWHYQIELSLMTVDSFDDFSISILDKKCCDTSWDLIVLCVPDLEVSTQLEMALSWSQKFLSSIGGEPSLDKVVAFVTSQTHDLCLTDLEDMIDSEILYKHRGRLFFWSDANIRDDWDQKKRRQLFIAHLLSTLWTPNEIEQLKKRVVEADDEIDKILNDCNLRKSTEIQPKETIATNHPVIEPLNDSAFQDTDSASQLVRSTLDSSEIPEGVTEEIDSSELPPLKDMFSFWPLGFGLVALLCILIGMLVAMNDRKKAVADFDFT